MRLLLFYRDLHGPGGVPREMRQLSSSMALCVTDFEAHSIARPKAKIVADEIDSRHTIHQAQPLRLDLLWPPPTFRESWRRSPRPDALVVVGGFIPENRPVADLAIRTGVPLFLAPVHAFDPPMFACAGGWRRRMYARLIECRFARKAAGIRLHSQAQIEAIERCGGVDQSRFFVVKCGPDWDRLEREAPALSTDEPWRSATTAPLTFGVLGRFDVYQKGLDVLLPAWRAYVESGGQGELLIAGSGTPEQTAALAALVSGTPNVKVLPRQEHGAQFEFLARLTYSVTLSRYEAIPRAATEALSVGCPLVVTPGTNLHDVVAEYEAGFTTELAHDAVVDVLRRAAAARDRREEFGRNALRLAHALDWDELGRAFVDEIRRRVT
jgi:glycosyltransferase involved in cell wall biosynthesis